MKITYRFVSSFKYRNKEFAFRILYIFVYYVRFGQFCTFIQLVLEIVIQPKKRRFFARRMNGRYRIKPRVPHPRVPSHLTFYVILCISQTNDPFRYLITKKLHVRFYNLYVHFLYNSHTPYQIFNI